MQTSKQVKQICDKIEQAFTFNLKEKIIKTQLTKL